MNDNSRLVYSTEVGRIRENNQPDKIDNSSADGSISIRRETKGRKGKGVTLISGFSMTKSELAAMAKNLRTKCGTGGTVKKGVIEIQGDKREVILELLSTTGFKAKIIGG